MKTTRRLTRTTIPAIAMLLLASAGADADSIILKNGTTYQGRILKDEGDTYLLQVQVTRSIREERRVAKADIEEIKKEDHAAIEFEELAKLVNTPDLLTTADYDARIRKLRAFIDRHRTAKQTTEARKLIRALEAERDEIAAGAIKLNGTIIPPAERNADAVAIDAAIMLAEFKEEVAGSKLLAALRSFARIEKNFPGSSAHLDALPTTRKVLATYLRHVTRAADTLDARLKQREVGLERMPDADRARAKAIFAEQAAAAAAQIAREREEGDKWLTIDPFDRSSLDEGKRRLEDEVRRLEQFDSSRLTPADSAYREAWTALEGADERKQREVLNKIEQLRLPEKYEQLLRERAAEAAASKDTEGTEDPAGTGETEATE